MKRYLPLLLLIFLIPATGWSATYYVDQTGGNDSNTGTDTNQTWKTINKVNRVSFSPGDSVLFKRGETWREQLTVPSSGSAGNPITFGAYGNGANPIIDGTDFVSNWTIDGGTIWKAALTTQPNAVWFNNTLGARKASIAALTSVRDWYWASNFLYTYSATDPDTAYVSPGIEAAIRSKVIYVHDKNYITFDGLTVTRGKGDSNDNAMFSVDGFGASAIGITIVNCNMTYAGARHLQLAGTTNAVVTNNTVIGPAVSGDGVNGIYFGSWNATRDGARVNVNPTVTNNTVHDLDYGIGLFFLTGGDISGNTVYNLGSSGITLIDGIGTINIHNNTIHDVCNVRDDTNAIQIGTETSDPTTANVYNNIIYNVEKQTLSGSGIIFDVSSVNCKAYNNNIYNTQGAGIHVLQSNGHYIYYNVLSTTGLDTRGDLSAGICIAGGDQIDVYNNVLYAPGKYGLLLLKTSGHLGTLNVKNNISSGSTSFAVFLDSSTSMHGDSVYNYNDWYFRTGKMASWSGKEYTTLAAWNTATGFDANSVSSDPLFVSTATPDFRLQAGSPAINAGTKVSLSTDYTGNKVPTGTAPDMGAYQYQEIRNPVPPGELRIY